MKGPKPLRNFLEEVRNIEQQDNDGARETGANKAEAETIDKLMLDMAAARWQLPVLEALEKTMPKEQFYEEQGRNSRAAVAVIFVRIVHSARSEELKGLVADFYSTLDGIAIGDDLALIRQAVESEIKVQVFLSTVAGRVHEDVQAAALQSLRRRPNRRRLASTGQGEDFEAESNSSADGNGRRAAGKQPRKARAAGSKDDDDDDDDEDDDEDDDGNNDDAADTDDLPASMPPTDHNAVQVIRKAIRKCLHDRQTEDMQDTTDFSHEIESGKFTDDGMRVILYKTVHAECKEIVAAFKAAQEGPPRARSQAKSREKLIQKLAQDAVEKFQAFEAKHHWCDFVKLLDGFMRYFQTFANPPTPKLLRLLRLDTREAHGEPEPLTQAPVVYNPSDDRSDFNDEPATPQDQVKKSDAQNGAQVGGSVAPPPPPPPRSAAAETTASASARGAQPSKLLRQLKEDFLNREGHTAADWSSLRSCPALQSRGKVTDFVQTAVAATAAPPEDAMAQETLGPLTQPEHPDDDVAMHHPHQDPVAHADDHRDALQQFTQPPASDDDDIHRDHHRHHEQHHQGHHQQHHQGHHQQHQQHEGHPANPRLDLERSQKKPRAMDEDDDHDDIIDEDDDRETVVDAARRLREQAKQARTRFKDPIDALLVRGKLAHNRDSSPGSTAVGYRQRPVDPKRKLNYDEDGENDSPFASQFGDDENRPAAAPAAAATSSSSSSSKHAAAAPLDSEDIFQKALRLRRKRRKPVPWTIKESDSLLEGVRTHGKGNWAAILRENPDGFHRSRTSVSLKDRYRNMEIKQQKEKELDPPEDAQRGMDPPEDTQRGQAPPS